MNQYCRQGKSRCAFTLVELLIVVGIIVVLVGILLPVGAGLRKHANETKTRALMQKIASACHAYYGDFNAYPGLIDDAQLYSPKQGNAPTLGPGGPTLIGAPYVTSSENLVLSLIGGVTLANGNFIFSMNSVTGGGIQSLNRNNPRVYSSYLDYKSADLSKGQFFDGINLAPNGGAADSPIPEFIDSFSNPKAIIYIRAKAGASGQNIVCEFNADGSDNTSSYEYFSGFTQPYWTVPSGSAYNYFVSPSVPNVPRGKDTFLLISAGIDGQYGTADDIISAD